MTTRFPAMVLVAFVLARTAELSAQSIFTIAGGGTGDGRPATLVGLSVPSGVAPDSAGNLYIAGGHRIRKVAAQTGIITTVAGNGLEGFGGDGDAATAASLDSPCGVTSDSAGNLYIADTDNNRLRRVAAGSGIITTVAGNGSSAFSGDGGAATAAANKNSLLCHWRPRHMPSESSVSTSTSR